MTGAALEIKNIIFDLGRVLIDFDHRLAASRIASRSSKSAEEILQLFFDSPLTADFEAGRLSAQEFFLSIKRMLDLRMDYEEFVPAWNEIFFFSEKNQQVYELALKLKASYRTALLSNVNVLHFDYIKKTFPVLDAFHTIIASFELGCVKPDLRIYNSALKSLGSKPEESFYTDDREELILSARGLGIRGFTFNSVEQLKKDLLVSGVRL